MKKKRGNKDAGSGASERDDIAAFEQALDLATTGQGGAARAPTASLGGVDAAPVAAAPVATMPFQLRDFFAEFDAAPNEFLALTETELKKQGRAERFSQRKIEDYLTFALGSEVYGVPISKVREIIKPQPLTLVPRQAAHVRGILSQRGAIVPVLSLAIRLGLNPEQLGRNARIVVFEDNDELVGFYVDEVREVVRLPVNSVEPPPQWRGSQHQDVIRGVGRVGGKMIILLEFDLMMQLLRAD